MIQKQQFITVKLISVTRKHAHWLSHSCPKRRAGRFYFLPFFEIVKFAKTRIPGEKNNSTFTVTDICFLVYPPFLPLNLQNY